MNNSRKTQVNPFLDTTSIPNYDKTMSNEKYKNNATIQEYYKFEKGMCSKIVYMTAKEYMDSISKYVFNDKDTYDAIINEKVDIYAEELKNGVKFPLPYIDFINCEQEGRHRMLASAKAFGKNIKFPVLHIYPTQTNEKEISRYVNNAYPNDIDWATKYVMCQLGMYDEYDEDGEISNNTVIDF